MTSIRQQKPSGCPDQPHLPFERMCLPASATAVNTMEGGKGIETKLKAHQMQASEQLQRIAWKIGNTFPQPTPPHPCRHPLLMPEIPPLPVASPDSRGCCSQRPTLLHEKPQGTQTVYVKFSDWWANPGTWHFNPNFPDGEGTTCTTQSVRVLLLLLRGRHSRPAASESS